MAGASFSQTFLNSIFCTDFATDAWFYEFAINYQICEDMQDCNIAIFFTWRTQ